MLRGIGCQLLINYQRTLGNLPEQRRPQLHREGNPTYRRSQNRHGFVTRTAANFCKFKSQSLKKETEAYFRHMHE
jgi:hypothetical protein